MYKLNKHITGAARGKSGISELERQCLVEALVYGLENLWDIVGALIHRFGGPDSSVRYFGSLAEDGDTQRLAGLRKLVIRSSMSRKRKELFFQAISFAASAIASGHRALKLADCPRKRARHIVSIIDGASDLELAWEWLFQAIMWADGAILRLELPQSVRRAVSRCN
jgi:hypothetical protein